MYVDICEKCLPRQARCFVYGSSASYYGLKGADMDICVRLDTSKIAEMEIPEESTVKVELVDVVITESV